jgi:hypothetical protein
MKHGHVTGTKREQHGQPMFSTSAADRIQAWEAKQAAEKAKEASK